MKVELERPDLIRLCIAIAKETSGDISKHKYKEAFTNINFVNGNFYRLNADWVNDASDELLFEFYKHHSQTIKLL
jgi:hypothetical protein